MPTAQRGQIGIHYEVHGDGPPLVMILGLAQDLPTWGLQIPELSRHFSLILFDNRDSGRSGRSLEDYSTQDMAQDTVALMDHLGLDRANVLGTSMGGMIAQHVALMAPGRIDRLILASTTASGSD